MAQLKSALQELSDSSQIREVNSQLKAWDKEARFFEEKEARLLGKINKLHVKIDKGKEIHQKASVVEDILKSGGEKI